MFITEVFDKQGCKIEVIEHKTNDILTAHQQAALRFSTDMFSLNTFAQTGVKKVDEKLCQRWTFSSKAPKLKSKTI
jgi:hypothetical protein